jgi:ABC-type transport system involved in cytochrome c biogenesis permease subunit
MKKLFLLIIFIFTTTIAHTQAICPLNGKPLEAKKVSSLKNLQDLPILDHGRIKPLDTYAQNILLQFSGKKSYDRKPAIHWLAKLLFSPDETRQDKIFLINNPQIPESLGIEVDKHRRYSFEDLEPALDKLLALANAADHIEPKERDIVESELVRLYKNIELYTRISLTFSFVFPHPDFTIEDEKNLMALGFKTTQTQFSFLDIAFKADRLHQLTTFLDNKPLNDYTTQETELLNLVNSLFSWAQVYQTLPVHILPGYTKTEGWVSPWDVIREHFQSNEGRQEILYLNNAAIAYWNGEQVSFDLALRNFKSSILKRLKVNEFKPSRIDLEIIYNQLNIFTWAKLIYFVIFLLFLLSLIKPTWPVYSLSFRLLVVTFSAHALALFMRILILQRPPVSNLYETFIFVSFVCVLVGLLIEHFNRQWLGFIIASVSGSIFLTIAGRFSSEGDTLQMLVAVLNSNFWLGTHVLTITIGYAGTCVAGIVGHIYILQSIFKSKEKKLLEDTHKILLGSMGFALTMTFLGTNLGGIWADESWGRFWGWDPKENGALLIILWLAILFHMKVGRMVSPLGLAVGNALGIIVVMWAWFGVNLLSIGLHSYGFTSGLANNLAIYFVLQILFVVFAFPIARKKLSQTPR